MNTKFFQALLFLVATTVSINVVAENLDDAVAAMHKGDFAVAYYILRPLAESGDAEAQYNIGWMYLNGYGLRVDENQALVWWTQASDQGHAEASFSIATLYSHGDGKVSKNVNKAVGFYLIAARAGHEDAIKLLKEMMMRNDAAIRGHINSIANQYGSLFGTQRLVKARKLNAREGASTREKVVAKLVEGQAVLELFKKGRWSHVVILGEKQVGDEQESELQVDEKRANEKKADKQQVDQTVWVYNPLLEKPNLSTASELSTD